MGMQKITKAEPCEGYRVDLTFDDGVTGIVDLSYLVGRGVFSSWQDYAAFRLVHVGETGDLRWPDGIDLCPDSLYIKVSGKSIEQVFPELTTTPSHA